MENKEINKLHYLYIIGILIAIIICLLTVNFGSNQNMINYLSFALTVTSLFLSLLAIIYAYYSNSAFSETISTLNKSSNDISEDSRKLQQITTTLDQRLEKLPELIKALEDKVDYTNAMLTDQKYERSNTAPNTEPNENLTDGVIKNFFNYSSTTGLFGLYAVYLSFSKTKPFTLKTLYEKSDLLAIEYTTGFLTSASSFGLFSRANYDELWTIIGFHKEIGEAIESVVYERAKADKADKVNGSGDYLYEQLSNIEKFFNEK